MIRSQFVTRKQKFRCPLLCSLLVASYLCKVNLKFVILPRRRPRVFYWKSVISRNENGPGRIYTAVRSSKAAKTTTGEVIKQEKVVKEGSCGVLPHLYAHGEAAKKAPLFPSTSYPLRFRYDFEAKDLVRGSSLPGRLFKKYYITSLMLAPCYRAGR